MNTLENMEPERVALIDIIKRRELHFSCAVFALVGGTLPKCIMSKSIRKKAIKYLRGSGCWYGTSTPEEIEQAVCRLREVVL